MYSFYVLDYYYLYNNTSNNKIKEQIYYVVKKIMEFKCRGQSNWYADNRDDNNHCVCLGAWSLYNKKLNIEKSKNKK